MAIPPRTPRMPKPPKPRTPKAETPRTPPSRNPMRTGGGRDVISITTRMRETPTKKGR